MLLFNSFAPSLYRGRTLYVNGTPAGNGADTTEDVLMSYTLPAGTLANVGDRVIVTACGTLAASTDTKNARIRVGGLGGTQLAFAAGNTVNSVAWTLEAWVMKTGSNTQTYGSVGVPQSGTVNAAAGTLSLTDTSTISIVVTGKNTSSSTANSIQCYLMSVDFVR